jgi:hypothetical protein
VRGFYDAGMLSRRNWVVEFIGYVLRRGLSDDPDWVFDTASELHPEFGNRKFAADSAFGSRACYRARSVGDNRDLKDRETCMSIARIAVRLGLVLLLASCGGSSGLPVPTPMTATWDSTAMWDTSTWE